MCIVWRLFRSVCLCDFDGSGVCSEPLLTSVRQTVTQLVQRERHSPSIKGCVRRWWLRYQGTNEDLPRKPERRPIIPFNSVLHGKVHGSESLNWSGALCQAGWIHTDEVLCDSLKWHFLAEMERPSACRLHSALPTCFFCSDFSPALIFDIFCLDYPTTFSLTTTTAMV